MSTPWQHHTEVRTEQHKGLAFSKRTEFYGVCDCGWVGLGQVTRRDAENDADEHVRMMAGEYR